MKLAKYRKALVAVLAAASALLAAGLLPQPYARIVGIVLAAAGAAGVYVVPNQGA